MFCIIFQAALIYLVSLLLCIVQQYEHVSRLHVCHYVISSLREDGENGGRLKANFKGRHRRLISRRLKTYIIGNNNYILSKQSIIDATITLLDDSFPSWDEPIDAIISFIYQCE
jgi:hypothetical protein